MSKEPNQQKSLTFSKLVIDLLKTEDAGMHKHGFPRMLRQILKHNTPLEVVFRRGINQTLGFIPDAFKIDRERQEITLYEVEDWHRLTIQKLWLLVNLWWVLDDIGWTLHLIIVDRYAVSRKELDLGKWSYLVDRY